ncbi:MULTISPECIES: chloride channel protein [Gammaproteobacteria]|jgi:CIC family chloride channel protein|uniref:chloride channel protein n=1 Tax=Gammaproteobacteria TaxID=1236 RepID=UPI001128CAA7|nr:chloride channel protein [Pseudomonas sp. Hp2]
MSAPAGPMQRMLQAIRRRFRTGDGWLIVLALLAGLIAGLLTLLQSGLAHALQAWLYGLDEDMRLSSSARVEFTALLALPIGGLLVGLVSLAATLRKRRLLDAVEANALHGGRMSMRDNLIVSLQTLLSNGFGASVGLEAAYTQMGAGSGSQLSKALRLRRSDTRTLVGAGAAGAIAAAFGTPLAGAFYAFEIVIGAYTPSALAPVAVAALAGSFIAQAAGVPPYMLPAASEIGLHPRDYAIFAVLGLVCALVGIAVMRLVTGIEQRVNRSPLPGWGRPVIGGLLLIPLAMATPQVLSSGHGALHVDLTTHLPLLWIGGLLLAKCLASGISLGFGFRGGLFFASLFMGTLVGALFAGLVNLAGGGALVDGTAAALAGMAALAAAVVGAPMTMAMLVLEGTHDFVLASAVMAAVLVANTVVRQAFGYSFSTWRLHLRGGTITSARDVGWVHALTAGKMMRQGTGTIAADASVEEFRRRFPLGSSTRVALLDAQQRYAGIVPVATVYADGVKADATLAAFAGNRNVALPPDADVLTVIRRFDETQSDEMAVVDAEGHLLGVLSEAFVRKRYAEELDKRQREMMGERVEDGEA